MTIDLWWGSSDLTRVFCFTATRHLSTTVSPPDLLARSNLINNQRLWQWPSQQPAEEELVRRRWSWTGLACLEILEGTGQGTPGTKTWGQMWGGLGQLGNLDQNCDVWSLCWQPVPVVEQQTWINTFTFTAFGRCSFSEWLCWYFIVQRKQTKN